MQRRGEPASWHSLPDGIELRTKARTDFWRHTHYGFVRDDGHLYYEKADGDLEIEATIKGDYREQYDQAGVMAASPTARVATWPSRASPSEPSARAPRTLRSTRLSGPRR